MALRLRPGFRIKRDGKGVRPGKGHTLAFALVETIFEMYCSEMSYSEIARQTGISPNVVWRYINKGDKGRNIQPLKVRREALIKRIQEAHDDKLVDTLARTRKIAAAAVDAIGKRVIDRVKNADLLEDPELYIEGNGPLKAAINQRAYNPEPSDLKAIIEASARLEQSQSSGSTVNVVQSQTQQQSQELAEEIDFVRENIANIQQSMGEDERRIAAKLIKGVNIASELDRPRLRNDGAAMKVLAGEVKRSDSDH